MRVPLKWLSDYVDLTLDPADWRASPSRGRGGGVITTGGDWQA
jgi:hypothetical protein